MAGFLPMKRSGFSQGIHEISVTKKEEIGTLRILADGRKFRYARAGSSALGAGKMGVAADIAANVTNQAMPATATTATSLTYTAGGAVTYVADYFSGGFLQINDAAGEGHQYEIESSSAVTAGTSIVITLRNRIKVALTTSSEGTLVHSPHMAVIESTDEENLPVGVAPVAVTASYYYWAQTGGPAICLVGDTSDNGTMMTLGSAAGELLAINSTLDIDMPICAIKWGNAGVDGEYKPVWLLID